MKATYPLRKTALEQLARFIEGPVLDYAQQRNYDHGPESRNNVSCLSVYIRNRVITEEEVVQAVLRRQNYPRVEKFIQEVFWRTYWKGWLELRPAVWTQYVGASQQAQAQWNEHSDYQAACSGTTGIECFDAWVHELIETGYLHNHARMWFASIWIFTLHLPWELGAQWFLRHLRDGDPAANTLSWRWVAGLHTQGKHYLARAANIAKYTRGRFGSPKLNEQAAPLTADRPLPQPEWNERYSPDHLVGKRYGLIVTDDDVAFNQAWMQRCVQAIGVIDQAAYHKHNIAASVFQYRYDSLKQSVESWASALSIPADVMDYRCMHRLSKWAVEAKLETVAIVQPTVGFLNGLVVELEDALTACGIELVVLRKTWDKKLFPHAQRGFFAFKKNIQDIVNEMQA